MKSVRAYIALLLIAAVAVGVVGCSATAKASDLMDGISSNSIKGKPTDDEFTISMADFSIELFKKSITADSNSLISPLSVMLALSMTANGADGKTLSQMEALLGGGIPISELNEYLFYYTHDLPVSSKAKLNIANSIWFRDTKSLNVFPEFLQTNADYYGASAYKSAFNEKTLKDINNWVNTNTDGMIKSILGEIDSSAMLYLINAIAFDAEWKEIYTDRSVRENDFTDISGNKKRVDFMYSTEWYYIDDGMATGFIKPYAGGRYSFAALLPNEGISPDEYIGSLTGARLLDALSNTQSVEVRTSMPKFEFEYDIEMKAALKALGMTEAFIRGVADFSKMGTIDGGLYIYRVIHKTFICVDERGTKAGAATAVEIAPGSEPGPVEHKYKVVNLDRPFVFAIIDNKTNLPIFIGTLMTVG